MKKLVIKSASGIKFYSFLLAVLFVFSCSKEESLITMTDGSSDVTLKKQITQGNYCLEGTSHFDFYAAKEKIVLSDGFLLCTATLTHTGGQNYLLETEESIPMDPPMLYRRICFDVKMTPSGAVMFSWPETWWELGTVRDDVLGQFLTHTGCITYGPGINKETVNYKGHFDGTNFHAKTHFTGEQVQPGTMYPDLVGGPWQIELSLNLTKVD